MISIPLFVPLAGIVGGALGGLAGFAMDRFPVLGLAPEKFWRTDPENVWVWAILVGASVGLALGAIAAAAIARRRS